MGRRSKEVCAYYTLASAGESARDFVAIVRLSPYELSRVFEERRRAKRCCRKPAIGKFEAKALAVGGVEWSMLRMPTFDRFV